MMGEAVSSNKPSDLATKNNKSTFSLTFFVGMAMYMTVIVIVGFWPTYFGHMFLGYEPADWGFVDISWKTHLHASVFMTWMILLLTQTFLVSRDNTKTHTKLGKYGFLFGILLVAVGFFMLSASIDARLSDGLITWAEVLPVVSTSPATVAMIQFMALLALGYYNRTNPSAHKRYMLIATIVLVNAATSRWRLLIGEWSVEILHVLMLGPIWTYDIYNNRRIHKATLIGTGIVGLYFLKRYLLS